MAAKKQSKKSTTKSSKSKKSSKSTKKSTKAVKSGDVKQYNSNPVMPPSKVEPTELDKVLAQVPQDQKEKLAHIKRLLRNFVIKLFLV